MQLLRSNIFRHITWRNVHILLRALRRESPRQILRNFRRLLRSQVPDAAGQPKELDSQKLYQLFLQREEKSSLESPDDAWQKDWLFPHTEAYRLAVHAATEVALFLQQHPQTDIIYCDEDQLNAAGQRHTPCFKPGWSPERLLHHNYIRQPLAVRKSAWKALGGLDDSKGEIAFWDLLLKAAGEDMQLRHLPKVLMHQVHESPNSRSHSLTHSSSHSSAPTPFVSILIPTKNNPHLLRSCLNSLRKTTYKNHEILILDNGSDKPDAIRFLKKIAKEEKIRVLSLPNPGDRFSYAWINNEGVKAAQGELILFLNDDTEVLSPDWLSHMVRYHHIEGVGMVGAKLLYPDGSLQHVGVATDMYMGHFEGFPVHYLSGQKADDPQLKDYTEISRNVAAVTGACCLIAKSLFEKMGGFDETRFPLSFNDIDLCLRLRESGQRIVLATEAVLIHKESKSRKGMPEIKEMIAFKKKYPRPSDPYYNPHFSRIKPFHIRPFGGMEAKAADGSCFRIRFAAATQPENRFWQQLAGALTQKALWELQIRDAGEKIPVFQAGTDLLVCRGNAAAPLVKQYTEAGVPVLWYLDEIPDEVAMAVLPGACGLIVPSHRMRMHAESLGTEVPIEVMKMALKRDDLQRFIEKTDKYTARKMLGIREDQLVFLHRQIGTDLREKEDVSYAFDRLSKEYPGKYKLMSLAAGDKDKWLAFQVADVYVQTAMHSTNACFLIQANYFGLPIVAYSDIGVGEYVIEDHNALLLPPADKRGLYRAMKKFALDTDMRTDFGHLSGEMHFLDPSFADMVEKMEHMMRKCIG